MQHAHAQIIQQTHSNLIEWFRFDDRCVPEKKSLRNSLSVAWNKFYASARLVNTSIPIRSKEKKKKETRWRKKERREERYVYSLCKERFRYYTYSIPINNAPRHSKVVIPLSRSMQFKLSVTAIDRQCNPEGLRSVYPWARHGCFFFLF